MVNMKAQPNVLQLPAALMLLLTYIAVVPSASGLEAQTAGWVQRIYSSSPSRRAAAGIAYDPATYSVLLFGGAERTSVLGDTWTWNGAWHLASPANSPSPRQGLAIAFDGATGNVVLFGGAPTVPVGAGMAFGDTWTWDGTNWTQQFPPVSPAPRTWTNMVYDPLTRKVVLFGGANSPDGDNAFDDTWAWDGIARTWTQLTPASHPSGRLTNQLVYDAANSTVVLFGGVTRNLTNLGDTWTWDGVDWTQQFPATSPAPRNGPALAYDTGTGKVVLFGGAIGTCCSTNVNDTWTWDGLNWTEIYPATSLPPARNSANMTYDPLNDAILLFGGDSPSLVLDGTWFLLN